MSPESPPSIEPASGDAPRPVPGGQDPAFVKGAFARIADRYVVTNHVLSCGTDILWRRKVGRMVAEWDPRRVLDVATGTGDLACEIQRQCPGADVVGTDFCEEMLEHARTAGVRETLVADALALPFPDGSFDLVTVAFGLRNMADWEKGLREMKRVIRPGGRLLVLDFSLPSGILARPYAFYLNRILPRIAGVLTGQREAYEYLAGSIERFPSGEAMLRFFRDCGYRGARWIPLTCGIASIYVGTVPAATDGG
ncbi:MAG: ubiquinone/menaquinone biosynthesis methyltransferase [Akkermansiaceae bacterium]|nr:ubiquinone/menaquinone biosynthesis methyltransferase [Akkermansiaceae bacterium]